MFPTQHGRMAHTLIHSWFKNGVFILVIIIFFLFQIHDFLTGHAPLVLAMRLGDHMMFIQLQLSTSPCSRSRPRPSPVPVPPPEQFSVRDHQEIPSPTFIPGGQSNSIQSNLHQFRHFPDNERVRTWLCGGAMGALVKLNIVKCQFYKADEMKTAQMNAYDLCVSVGLLIQPASQSHGSWYRNSMNVRLIIILYYAYDLVILGMK